MSSEHTDIIRRVIRSFPVQLNAGLLVKPPPFEGLFSNLLVCGMGGSALAGRLLKRYLRSKGLLEMDFHNNYDLPLAIDSSTLVIALSFSGNTEEALSAFDAAHERSLPLIAISTGGQLEEKSSEIGVPWLRIPTPEDIPDIQPRHAVPAQLGLLVSLLAHTTTVDLQEELRNISDGLEPIKLESMASTLLADIGNRTPIIYSSKALSAVAYNWKIQMNETAKRHAFANLIPESNHNELAAENRSDFHALFLHDPDGHDRTNQRLHLMHEIITENSGTSTIVDIPGSTSLERHLNGMLIGWWLAELAAEQSGIDPLTIDSIENFKTKLNK